MLRRKIMKTFQQYLNEKENIDEGVKDYIKATVAAFGEIPNPYKK